MSKTILAIIENERFPFEVAMRAARIAKLYDGDIQLLLSDPTVSFLRSSFMISADAKQIADNVRQAQQEELERIVESIAEYGLNVSTSIVHERPASDAIIARALEVEPFVVVKGTTYHSPAERAVFTFNDWQLIRKLDYPLWLVKTHEWKEDPVIVAAVDPMHPDDEEGGLTQAIVDSARSVSERTGGQLLLLHTYELLEEVSSWAKLAFKPLKVPMEELQQKMQDEHRRHLDSLAANNDIDAGSLYMLPGRTREILPAFAREKNADLVVMGAVARSGLKRRIIGSTAEHVLDHVPCDILIERMS
ncbi:MAG: universal stress protein [Woeseiaceae bacterium]|nr:universal stress protein [Woeseiaceae bacterium]NIP19944.1 universal stress protein [Woeseiaceae bacterium]NIS88745.1 universal stress protein [Woeseiaceae bacterium]